MLGFTLWYSILNPLHHTKIKMNILSECTEFYEAYQWEKCSFKIFYSRRVRYKNEPLERLVQPKCIITKRRKDYSWPYWESLKKFDELPKQPIKRNKFYQRLTLGYTFEEAIKTWKAFEKISQNKKKNMPVKIHRFSKHVVQEEKKPSYVDVTYPKEVAKVFRDMYNEMIENIENDLEDLRWTVEELREARKRLENLKEELCVFNYYNK